ncbi:MAG: Ig-like domain-containing protein [Deltaproteobacteria bacterium]|nr:Ig-like domain-containing protein [Deltaproteobacteria bacterium]
MTRTPWLTLAVVTAAWTTVPTRAQAQPPKVVATVPTDGAQVDPSMQEIRVTFDQDMDPSSYSWTGGGPTFPRVRGKPRWDGARECVLPVHLEPGHDYRVGINGPNHRNFKSKTGAPAAPYLIRFRTLSSGTRGKRDGGGAGTRKEQNPAATARIAARLLGHARDVHIWLEAEGERIATHSAAITANYDGATRRRLLSEAKERGPCLSTGRFGAGLGYLEVRSFDKHACVGFDKSLHEAFDDLKGMDRLVIDVRSNRGGDERLARSVAAHFISRPVVYAKHVVRDATAPLGFSGPHSRALEPASPGSSYSGKVVVLMGPANMSSAEAFLLMMRAAGAKLVGARSRGASGNPQPVDLGNGVVVYLPSWKAMRADGSPLEGEGILPDVEVNASHFKRRDPVVAAAMKILGQ